MHESVYSYTCAKHCPTSKLQFRFLAARAYLIPWNVQHALSLQERRPAELQFDSATAINQEVEPAVPPCDGDALAAVGGTNPYPGHAVAGPGGDPPSHHGRPAVDSDARRYSSAARRAERWGRAQPVLRRRGDGNVAHVVWKCRCVVFPQTFALHLIRNEFSMYSKGMGEHHIDVHYSLRVKLDSSWGSAG